MNGPNDMSGVLEKNIPKQCIWHRFGPIMLLSPVTTSNDLGNRQQS